MTRPSIERLLWNAARLRTLVAIGKARLRRIDPRSETTTIDPAAMTNTDLEPNEEAMTLAAELLQRIALKPDGTTFGDSPEDLDAAELAEPEIVRLGPVKFRIIDSDPSALAFAVGAIEEGAPPTLCLLVEFDQVAEQAQPVMGQFIVLPTGEEGVALTFVVWLSHADLHDPAAPDLGPDAVRNEAMDAIGPNQALIVQVFETDDQAVDE